MFNPCVIVPVYNHHQRISQVVERLLTYGLPVFLLNDGSAKECSEVLESVARRYSDDVFYKAFECNRGKGAVVCEGLIGAAQGGFTHALQVDADGQHDLNDVPKFLALGQEFPHAVVSGSRDYAQMPASRRKGRKLTDFWVRVNTLSSEILDSMCGYRLYPLAETCDLIGHRGVGKRMDFDTDILVRLYWQGVGIKHVDTRIVYDDEIASNFDMVLDNLRISAMHTKLFLGMLVRSPKLLRRRYRSAA